MVVIIVALVVGFLVARLDLLPQVASKGAGKIGHVALIVLLFSMGLSLGANPELISALPNLGLKALMLSLGSIFGSVLLVWIVTKLRRPAQ